MGNVGGQPEMKTKKSFRKLLIIHNPVGAYNVFLMRTPM
jgi:hypothetical protein